MMDAVSESIREHIDLVTRLQAELPEQLPRLAQLMVGSLYAGGTIFWCGNGGSAADSQHFAAELVGRYKRERPAIASVALTTDSSVLTAIGNDYSYEEVFRRQVEAVVRRGDIVVGISTSGNSQNVVHAVQKARQKGAVTIGMLGRDGGVLRNECEHVIIVPSKETARIQEMHLMIGHILCDLVEGEWAR